MCFALRHVFIVSDPNNNPVALPPVGFTNQYVGAIGRVSGFGVTTEGECVDPFNSFSKDKELFLYSQCHMDLTEVTQKYVI
jgi:hypothetical protein